MIGARALTDGLRLLLRDGRAGKRCEVDVSSGFTSTSNSLATSVTIALVFSPFVQGAYSLHCITNEYCYSGRCRPVARMFLQGGPVGAHICITYMTLNTATMQ